MWPRSWPPGPQHLFQFLVGFIILFPIKGSAFPPSVRPPAGAERPQCRPRLEDRRGQRAWSPTCKLARASEGGDAFPPDGRSCICRIDLWMLLSYPLGYIY